MKDNDAELIRLTLDGDESAFTDLVKKYEKAVQVLVWQKIGDFHTAEEITQDIFLKVYQELRSLKKPQSFVSWLYVITSRHCLAWQRKKRLPMLPFDETKGTRYREANYSQHIIEENQRISEETQREVVRKLLAKLPESERTVITLHYFSDMSSSDIGKFLGVSANTIRSRLRRAKQRLRKEESIIREALEQFQMTPNITENIIQEISRLKPIPQINKPILPWLAIATSAILIVLMLGIGSQFLTYFQKPYSFDSQSEMSVELLDTSIVLDIDMKTDERNQIGSENTFTNNDNSGQRLDDKSIAATQNDGVDVSSTKQQWIPTSPIKGSPLRSLNATPEGEIYALGDELHFYKLSADGSKWQYLSDLGELSTRWSPTFSIAKWKDSLYLIQYNELFTSTDDGKTWDLLHKWSYQHDPKTIVGTENALYIGFRLSVMQSEDYGKTWRKVNEGLDGRIKKLIQIKNILFAATDQGLFRFNGNKWEAMQLPHPVIVNIHSIAVTEETLYVSARFSFESLRHHLRHNFSKFRGMVHGWRIYRSADIGNSWNDITPTNAWSQNSREIGTTLLATGETLIAMEQGIIRSTDRGDTWLPFDSSVTLSHFSSAITQRKGVYYITSIDGLHRSTDDGESWHKVNIPQESEKTPIEDLIVSFNTDKKQNSFPNIYARYGGDSVRIGEIAETSNHGKTWQTLQMDLPPISERKGMTQPSISQIVKCNGEIYAKGGDNRNNTKIMLYHVSQEQKKLVPIQDIPIFDGTFLRIYHVYTKHTKQSKEILLTYEKKAEENAVGAEQFFKLLNHEYPDQYTAQRQIHKLFDTAFWGPFVMTNDTIYMEYNFKLFRWTTGDKEWYDTGLEETGEIDLNMPKKNLKLAVSGNTVYVGKRDGRLLVSFDRGNNWTDLTPDLPFKVKTFKDILVEGSSAYIATDSGVIRTYGGRRWHTVPDTAGTNLIMERLVIDENVVYGATKQSGIYRLENGRWQQVVSNTPDNVTSLAVAGETIYIGTEHNQILHYTLTE